VEHREKKRTRSGFKFKVLYDLVGSSYDSTNSNRITQSTTLDDWKWAPTEQANTDRDLPPVQRNNHHVSLFKKRFQHHRHHQGTKKNCQTQDIGFFYVELQGVRVVRLTVKRASGGSGRPKD
jgi:hypothetical protein